MFSGTIRMKVCEASGLRPTDFQKRHTMTFGKPDDQLIDPYISVDVDENHLGECPFPNSYSCTRLMSFSLSRRPIDDETKDVRPSVERDVHP